MMRNKKNDAPDAGTKLKRIAFLCFILSGAASVSYQLIWLRLAMTYFGVITPVISAILSIFMLGLGIGTIVAGKFSVRLSGAASLRLYALMELFIGGYALCVPALFREGYTILLSFGTQQSASYLFLSWLIIATILLPVCVAIGCTFPLLMHCLKSRQQQGQHFGFLYFANVLGAMTGTFLPLLLIEITGFRHSILIIALLNLCAALLALLARSEPAPPRHSPRADASPRKISFSVIVILFLFGFATMGSELVWIRAYMPEIGPAVYSFGAILAVYFFFTALGTWCHLSGGKDRSAHRRLVIVMLPLGAVMAILSTSLHGMAYGPENVVIGMGILCFCLGYLTPGLIDEECGNDVGRTMIAYTCNFAGCILGPLFSTYILFPFAGVKGTLLFYSVILLGVSLFLLRENRVRQYATLGLFAVFCGRALTLDNYENLIEKHGTLVRDNVGYIGAIYHDNDGQKALLVNGQGMTALTMMTKNMAHLPLAYRPHAKNVLDICMGMGTTLRSLTSWPLEKITVAELSKGVTMSFPYFHDDTARVLADPRVHIVIDDGRRYVNRTHDRFDVITIDPPPPVWASGSGLLYTTEFVSTLKSKMNPGGVLQQIIPVNMGDAAFWDSAINAIKKNFTYVRIYDAVPNGIVIHVLASDSPLPPLRPEEMLANMPASAKKDFKEWFPGKTLEEVADMSLHEIPETDFMKPEYKDIYMSDDRLYNEFDMLRSHGLYTPGRQ